MGEEQCAEVVCPRVVYVQQFCVAQSLNTTVFKFARWGWYTCAQIVIWSLYTCNLFSRVENKPILFNSKDLYFFINLLYTVTLHVVFLE